MEMIFATIIHNDFNFSKKSMSKEQEEYLQFSAIIVYKKSINAGQSLSL